MARTLRPLGRLYQLLGSDLPDLVTLFIYAVFVGLLTLAIPVAVQALVGTVAFGALLQPIFVLSLLLLVGLSFSATVRAFEAWVIERLQQRLFVRTALRYVGRLSHSTSGASGELSRDELLNRFFDLATAHKALSVLVADGLAITLQTCIGIVALAFYHPWLLAFGILLVLSLAFVLFGLGRGALRTSVAESTAKYETAAWLEDVARHPGVFRGAGAKHAEDKTQSLVHNWIDERRAHFRVLFRQHIGLLVVQVTACVSLLAVGGALVVARQLTLGQLIAAELIVSALAAGIGKFGKSLDAAYDLMTSAEKLMQVEDALVPEADGDAQPFGNPAGATLELRDVVLSVRGEKLLHVPDLVLSVGDRVALVGRAGTGKSALLDLVHGDWDGVPPAGAVEIDGVDQRSWQRHALRQRVALVRRGATFAGTVEENVSLHRDGIGPIEVQRALEMVGLWRKIASMPEGMARVLRSGGAPLSPGEQMLVVLARALIGGANLLLVDGLGDLDDRQRARVLDILHDRHRPMTVLYVANDPRLVGDADRVCTIEDGVLLDCIGKNQKDAA